MHQIRVGERVARAGTSSWPQEGVVASASFHAGRRFRCGTRQKAAEEREAVGTRVLKVASALHPPVSKNCAEVDHVTVISFTNQVWPPADVSQMKVSLFCLVFLLFSLPF